MSISKGRFRRKSSPTTYATSLQNVAAVPPAPIEHALTPIISNRQRMPKILAKDDLSEILRKPWSQRGKRLRPGIEPKLTVFRVMNTPKKIPTGGKAEGVA